MNQYVTGAIIKELREKNKMTQLQLAEKLGVSDKTISKWETGKGYPDITCLSGLRERDPQYGRGGHPLPRYNAHTAYSGGHG